MFSYKHITANSIQLTDFPFQRELAMEAYLLENESVLALDNKNFNEVSILESELHLVGGRKATDGRIDILAGYGSEYLAVIELKLGELNAVHVEQLAEYLASRETLLTNYPHVWDSTDTQAPKWIGVLVGSAIKPELALEIRNGLTVADSVPLVAITLRRFRAEDGQILVVTDIYANLRNSSKDFTRYLFEGEEYGKGRLVLALVKAYVARHKNVTFSELKQAFPDNLIKPKHYGVFTLASEANALFAEKGRKRHYIKPDELIALGDGNTIAVCSQWGIEQFDGVLARAAELNLIVSVVNS